MNILQSRMRRENNVNIEEFDYDLPESLIAQTPLKDRDHSRLLVMDRETGEMKHLHFKDIIEYFRPGDTLVLNDTRVMPARLFGLKEETGAKVEMLMLTQIEGNDWEVLLKPAKRIKVGNKLNFGNGKIIAECIKEMDQGGRIMRLHYEGILQERLDELGEMPLPPYIKERLDDPDRYQTVYAKESGSAAAPTAGLHFTDELLIEIKNKGVNIAFVTLHVGLGTFRPVSVDDVNDHEMHSEYYQMTQETADLLNDTKSKDIALYQLVQLQHVHLKQFDAIMINLLKRVAGLIYLFIQDLILKQLMARLLIFIYQNQH